MSKTRCLYFPLFSIVAMLAACIRLEPCVCREGRGPFIDSAGFRASQIRVEKIVTEDSDELISQAIRSPEAAKDGGEQPEFFQSIEDNYQRYRQLFYIKKKSGAPEVRCNYDLIETFRLKLFDPQPFMNAILHTFPMQEVTTLDFDARPHAPDTLVLQVSWVKAASSRNDGNFTVTEGILNLYVTKHTVSLTSPLAEDLVPKEEKRER